MMNAEQKALAVINDFAPKIIAAHEAVQSNAKTMMEYAIVAGELLVRAKKKVGHGNWANWVVENCKFSARTATRLHANGRTQKTNRQRPADFDLRRSRQVSQAEA
jgi:Protein of unknown function (DUF3102)